MYVAPQIPASVRALMAEIGPRWGQDIGKHVKLMLDAFTPLLAQAPEDGVVVEPNLAYGSHARHVLDVYRAPRAASDAPVVVFVHGGAFVDGDKNRTPQIYGNVLRYFARHGVHGVNMTYRLAPESRHPGGAQDVGAAVAWVRANAANFGWDTRKVFLFGHSAGATHAGLYAYDRRLWPAGGPGVAGLVIVSGRMRADMLAENPNASRVAAYFGTDSTTMEDGSPVNHVGPDSVSTFVAMAEFENPLLDVYCTELAARLAAAHRRAPPCMWLRGHNHTSIIAHFNTAEDALGRDILAFIHAPRDKDGSAP